MQRRGEHPENIGDGIYRKSENSFDRNRDKIRSLKKFEGLHLDAKDCLIKTDDIERGEKSKKRSINIQDLGENSLSAVQQLINAREALEILDKRVSSYKKLNNQGSVLSLIEFASSLENLNNQHENSNSHVGIDELLAIASNTSIPPETRRYALNYYVKHNIEESSDECGCHFHHYDNQSESRSGLLGKLNECYRKLANERDKLFDNEIGVKTKLESLSKKDCESSEGISIKQSSHGDDSDRKSDRKSVELVSSENDENVCCQANRDLNGGSGCYYYYHCERDKNSLFIDNKLGQPKERVNQRRASIESILDSKIKPASRKNWHENGRVECRDSSSGDIILEKNHIYYENNNYYEDKNHCNTFCCQCSKTGRASSICKYHSSLLQQSTSREEISSYLENYEFFKGSLGDLKSHNERDNYDFILSSDQLKSDEEVLSEVGNALVSVSDSLEELPTVTGKAFPIQQALHSFGLASPLNTNCYHYCYGEVDKSERDPLLPRTRSERSASLDSILREGYCLHCCFKQTQRDDLTCSTASLAACSHSHKSNSDGSAARHKGVLSSSGSASTRSSCNTNQHKQQAARGNTIKANSLLCEINVRREEAPPSCECRREWTSGDPSISESLVVQNMGLDDDAIGEKQLKRNLKLTSSSSSRETTESKSLSSASQSSASSSLNKENINLVLQKRFKRRRGRGKGRGNWIQERDDQIARGSCADRSNSNSNSNSISSGGASNGCSPLYLRPQLTTDCTNNQASSKELNYLSDRDENYVGSHAEANDESMLRAVKDIVKMSAPSLSALQYLPAGEIVDQALDGRKRRAVDTDGQQIAAGKLRHPMQSMENIDFLEKNKINNKNKKKKKSKDSIRAIKRPKEADQHDETCLLHKLCLCSCMAKSSQVEGDRQKVNHPGGSQAEDFEEELKPSKSRKKTETRQHSKTTSPSSSASSRTTKASEQKHTSVSPSKSRASNDDDDDNDDSSDVQSSPTRKESGKLKGKSPPKRNATGEKKRNKKRNKGEEVGSEDASDLSASKRLGSASLGRQYEEKQSPSFLNLLRSPSSHIARRTPSPLAEWPRKRKVGTVSPSQLGSTGEPTLMSASSSPGIHSELSVTSNSNVGECSSFLKELHSSSSSLQQRPSSSELEFSQEDKAQNHSKSPSSAAPGANKSLADESKSPYKRLLSTRRRLFSPSIPPSENVTNCLSDQQASGDGQLVEPDNKSNHKQHQREQKSFFVRSLQRFSHRTRSSQAKKAAGEKKQQENLATASTPELHLKQTDSKRPISSIESKDNVGSLTNSSNSLEGIVLPQQKLLVQRNKALVSAAPDIVLSRAESVATCSSGGETPSSIDMTRSGSFQHSLATSWRPGCRDEATTSDNSSERAYSLPATPYYTSTYGGGSRESGRSRSPRLSHSPVAFNSPPSQSTQIEDGLKVCSVEHFEKHIGNIRGTQVEVQKRLFKNWINHFSPNLIQRDLIEELRDGIKLIGLIGHLTRDKQLLRVYEKLKADKQSFINRLVVTPSSRLRHLSNVSTAIDYLRQKRGMKLINLNPMDIVSGKANVILGLCWNIILNFQLEQNFFKFMDGCELGASRTHSFVASESHSYCTSRLSVVDTNEDRAQCFDNDEQKVRNWISYETAQKQLKDWLVKAESKLSTSLEPIQSALVDDGDDNQLSTFDKHSDNLKGLIDYFELEPVDPDIDDALGRENLDNQGKTNSLDSIPLNFLNLSGSLRSLVSSASSRISTLQSSKKATYSKLFDNFELKCRTLAAQLDVDQREALLKGVEELRSHLTFITEVRVPQVVSELKALMERINEEKIHPSIFDAETDQENLKPNAGDMCESDSLNHKDDSGFISTTQPEKNTSIDEIHSESQTEDLVDSPDVSFSLASALWHKITRAYRTSLPLNIALLICLVGICLVPLFNKDACCELSVQNIPADEFRFHEKPT